MSGSDSKDPDKNSDPALAPTELAPSDSGSASDGSANAGSSSRSGFASRVGRLSRSGSTTGGRFLPGDMVADRYRIVGLLGRGGMGEVYRADDLTLGQPVALKFLPKELEQDPDRLERFLHEVRVARQVSHANVCRVYDLGLLEGSHYLSMEFIDGEDLSTLLRRIGRLPEDKTVQIARQICAGLAAAHARGIVHRDLKPANIMLDDDGQVKITDFGLAGLASSIRGLEIRSGTPDYMSPEQLAGHEVSIRSDLYALGLVLYELFTGRRAYEAKSVGELRDMQKSTTPVRPTSLVGGLDPAIEKVIDACLETDPQMRPSSALAVSGALPGGDPIAAALAAGETPSPEMVAASGRREAVRPWVALGGLAFTVLCLFGLMAMAGKTQLVRQIEMTKSGPELQTEARLMLDRLGHSETPVDRAGGFFVAGDYARWRNLPEQNEAESERRISRWADLNEVRPSPWGYWYRESPRPLVSLGTASVDFQNPPQVLSGMHSLRLDAQGRLIGLQSVPPQVAAPLDPAEPAPTADWGALLEAAKIDLTWLTPAEPEWAPMVHSDERVAWTGTYPEWPDRPIRIEAAAFRGKPVHFQIVAPWTEPTRMQPPDRDGSAMASVTILLIFLFLVLGLAIFLARRNLLLERVDRKGAFRLAIFIAACMFAIWLLGSHHTVSLGEVQQLLLGTVARALLFGGMVWVTYLALEPYVRKLWPELMVSWARLIAGRINDPLVGRDLLLGCAAGTALAVASSALQRMPQWLGRGAAFPVWFPGPAMDGVAGGLATLAIFALNSVGLAVLYLLVVMFVRFFTERTWIAIAVPALLMGGAQAVSVLGTYPEMIPLLLGFWLLLMFTLARLGLLGFVVAYFVGTSWVGFPLTFDASAFYAPSGWVYPIVVLSLAGFGAYRAMAGESILRDPFAG